MVNEKKIEDWISEGLIVAACPILAYLYAFSYEAGFASFFKIPLEFIVITTNNIILFFAGLFVVCLLIYLPLEVIGMWIPRRNPIFSRLIKYIPMFMFFISMLYLYGVRDWKTYAGWLPITAFLIFRDFIAPLITQKDKKTYLEKLSAWEIKDKEDFNKNPPLILYSFFNWFKNRNSVFILLFLLYLISYSYQMGSANAGKQEVFLVCHSSPKTVVLRIYGDNLISAPFDEKTKNVKSSFFVYKITSDYQEELSLEKVGPLLLQK